MDMPPFVVPPPRRRRSSTVTPEKAAIIKALLKTGMYQHEIAALLEMNQGRVSEINTGKKFPEIEPLQGDLFG
ncbi:Uncharacterised protein [Pannonibacter phragmitetus]|uniref:Uncharacterized protein n=1 Tax=Pannonibacter phragmitetus TaxID=121719 RepID=A0A378ZPF5_9HYPH|nr:hypothetical protein [Pannonibacter phragmitetus]SUA99165.1 Uncharacterised protein [Pannonibacter phragmitetus]